MITVCGHTGAYWLYVMTAAGDKIITVFFLGFRNGNLYFPWSLVPRKYLDFLVPQSPLPTTPNQRPNFWHYSGHGKKMRTEGTQTKLQQLWHNRISQSSCESRGVLYNPHGGEDPSLEKMCEAEVGEMDSCPQGHMPSAARWPSLTKSMKPFSVT